MLPAGVGCLPGTSLGASARGSRDVRRNAAKLAFRSIVKGALPLKAQMPKCRRAARTSVAVKALDEDGVISIPGEVCDMFHRLEDLSAFSESYICIKYGRIRLCPPSSHTPILTFDVVFFFRLFLTTNCPSRRCSSPTVERLPSVLFVPRRKWVCAR